MASEKTPNTDNSSRVPTTLSAARSFDWSTITLEAPLSAPLVEMLASVYGVKYYARRSKEQNLRELLSLDEKTFSETGMHRLPANILDTVQKTLESVQFHEESESKRGSAPLDGERQEKIIAQSFDLQTRPPRWFYLGGKECAIMPIDEGLRYLIHQVDGTDGMLVYSRCPNGDPSLRSCAVPLTMAAISRFVNINVIIDNVVMKKSAFIKYATDLNITSKMITDHVSMDAFVNLVSSSCGPFSLTDIVFVERTETDLQPFDPGTIVDMKSNSLRRAGEVFMFNLVFGISDSSSSYRFKETAKYITRIVIDPAVKSVHTLLELAEKSYSDVVKSYAERAFMSTNTILDDAQFMEGMNTTRERVLRNKSQLLGIIETSPMADSDKQTLKKNIAILERTSLVDFLILLSQQTAGSPWKPTGALK